MKSKNIASFLLLALFVPCLGSAQEATLIDSANGLEEFATVVKDELSALHERKEMKTLVQPEQFTNGGTKLCFIQAKKRPVRSGCVDFGELRRDEEITDVRYAVVRGGTDIRFDLNFNIVGDRHFDEIDCTLSIDKKEGSLTVTKRDGDVADRFYGDARFSARPLWSDEFHMKEGSRFYQAVMSAIEATFKQKSEKVTFNNRSFSRYRLKLPGTKYEMAVHDMDRDGTFGPLDEARIEEASGIENTYRFSLLGDRLTVDCELNPYVLGSIAMATQGSNDKQWQINKQISDGRPKYATVVRDLINAGYPK
jgi:hypothetical protein